MKLYKYFAPQRIDVLTHRRIRYTQPGAFNDPFEVKPYVAKFADDAAAERTVDQILPEEIRKAYEQLPAEIRAVIPYEAFLKIATQGRESLRGQFGVMLSQYTPMLRRVMEEKFNELLGILSLTEKPDNLLMWSHYAASHAGFVIGFNSSHDYFDQRKSPSDEFRHLRKVEYRAVRPNAPLSELDGIDVFLVKSTEWEYEQEWRIMRPLSDAADTIPDEPFPICLFEFSPAAVTDVILGARMRDTDRSTIRDALKSSPEFAHVEIFNALPHEIEFKIMLEKYAI
jgi:hypothetical protein